MLVLTRYENESIQIGPDITIRILEHRGRRTKLGIEAPGDVSIHRTEVIERPDFHDSRAEVKPAAAKPLTVATVAKPNDGQ